MFVTEFEKAPERCPKCGQMVDMIPAGWSQRGNDPRTYPWMFVEHNRPEVWGGKLQQRGCPGGGCNPAMARE